MKKGRKGRIYKPHEQLLKSLSSTPLRIWGNHSRPCCRLSFYNCIRGMQTYKTQPPEDNYGEAHTKEKTPNMMIWGAIDRYSCGDFDVSLTRFSRFSRFSDCFSQAACPVSWTKLRKSHFYLLEPGSVP